MRKSTILITILFIAVIGSLVLYAKRGAVYAEMNALKLVPQNEAFTELYFNNYAALPKATVAQQPVSFAFTIHNVEGATTTYPYSVYFLYPDGSTTTFENGIVTLPNNASTSITVTHTFLASNLTGSVVVDLPSLNNQSIDFLVPDTN